MCGICGYWSNSGDVQILENMTQSIKHRGPDSNGTFVDGEVGLGHARLSILDLSEAGHQPMAARDGTTTIAFNGEVYNFQEISRQLGMELRSHSDTEVVLEAYCKWGEQAFAKFDGMFGFAIWDAKAKQLTLARDRFGIKPVSYTHLTLPTTPYV